MSYRHPRFYREDFTGFNRGFQSAFQQQFDNVTDYFDKKIEARKEYEADLHAQADKMREEAEAAGNIGAEFQQQLETKIQDFLKEGLKMEATGKKGGIGLFGTNVKEFKKSQLDLDKANANFNAQIAAANGITDRAFIQDLQIDDDYDHGSGSYLEYATVIKALKGNFKEGGNIAFDYKGDNDFSMGVTVNNPRYDDELPEGPDNKKQITYSAQEIQRLIGENDPEARKQIEENIAAAEESLLNQAKSDLEKRFAYGSSVKGTEGNMEGKAYYGETDVRNRVNQFVNEMMQQDENNPDESSVIDDIYNNKVKFNDAIRLEELKNVGGAGTSILLDKVKDPKLADELAMLLDLPKNDISYQKKILSKMGITDPEQIKQVRNSLDEAKNNMVKRYLTNSVMGSGITSKFVSPTQPRGDGSGGRGSTSSSAPNLREISIADQSGRFLEVSTDNEKLAGDYTKLFDNKLLPRNVKQNEDGTYDFEVKSFKWFVGSGGYKESTPSQEEFKNLLEDPKFKEQYLTSLQEADYGDFDPTEYENVDLSNLEQSNVTVDGSKKQIYETNFDRSSGELTLFLEDPSRPGTSKNTKTYNMRTQSGYMDYYMDRLGYSTQKERDEGFDTAANLMVDELVQNDYNDSFSVNAYEFLEDGPVRDIYTVKKYQQDYKIIASKLAQQYPNNEAKQQQELDKLLKAYDGGDIMALDKYIRN